MAIKHYANEEITIKWQSDLCIHSRICFKGLKDVFDPQNRPWVNIAGSDNEKIMAQIDQCPSGALSYTKTNEPKNQSATPSKTKVEVMPNGPLLVHGDIEVQYKDQNEVKQKVSAFCRCGASSNKPYCDGSHQAIGFEG
ncbi:MAG: (4Fe-4S)-binding protein [Reichenbachiella sp.]